MQVSILQSRCYCPGKYVNPAAAIPSIITIIEQVPITGKALSTSTKMTVPSPPTIVIIPTTPTIIAFGEVAPEPILPIIVVILHEECGVP
ncbi:unnamed protein product [Linum trigynum]|uniref:Uncharacterized protein n=1 Tax=Linum trigynum TaxID=586398 RepID=A0AAV2EAY5_9ROSI